MLAFGMLAGKRHLLGPKTYADAMDSDVADKWKGAMDAEIKSIWKNDTWELIPPLRLWNHAGYFVRRITASTKLVSVQRGIPSNRERTMMKPSRQWQSTRQSGHYL